MARSGGCAVFTTTGKETAPARGQAEAILGPMPGAARHDSDVGWQSAAAAAINFCVKVACFEITSGQTNGLGTDGALRPKFRGGSTVGFLIADRFILLRIQGWPNLESGVAYFSQYRSGPLARDHASAGAYRDHPYFTAGEADFKVDKVSRNEPKPAIAPAPAALPAPSPASASPAVPAADSSVSDRPAG
jgi:hypothetical protein